MKNNITVPICILLLLCISACQADKTDEKKIDDIATDHITLPPHTIMNKNNKQIDVSNAKVLLSSEANSQQSLSPKSPQKKSLVDAPIIHTYVGTVEYKDFEGGFYGIRTKNKQFTPSGLTQEYRRNGLVIEFSGYVIENLLTTTQYGEPFRVNTVRIIDESNVSPPPSKHPQF